MSINFNFNMSRPQMFQPGGGPFMPQVGFGQNGGMMQMMQMMQALMMGMQMGQMMGQMGGGGFPMGMGNPGFGGGGCPCVNQGGGMNDFLGNGGGGLNNGGYNNGGYNNGGGYSNGAPPNNGYPSGGGDPSNGGGYDNGDNNGNSAPGGGSNRIGGPTGQLTQRAGGRIDSSIAPNFDSMVSAARADGINLQIRSGHRSRGEQERLYAAYRNGTGNLAARPGTSNHERGQAIDFQRTPGAFDWLARNAERFGFRNLPGEPWHYSPTGR